MDSMIVSITPLSGPSIVSAISTIVEETRQPLATYTVQAMCRAWNQSRLRLRVRSVGAASIQQCRDMNKCTWKGNNQRINAHIHDVF